MTTILILSFALFVMIVAKYAGLFDGVPYLPTDTANVEKMIELAEIKPKPGMERMKMVDLGSGDGRIVLAASNAGAKAIGYEINPLLVFLSRRKIAKSKPDSDIEIIFGNFWDKNFHDFDVVTVYGVTQIMGRLEKKLQAELRPGAKVISHGFTFPTWPSTDYGRIRVYTKL